MYCEQIHLEADNQLPHVVIKEQPKSGSNRFRYECEKRSAGNILGLKSTVDNMTFPTIKLVNCCGPGTVYVSLVTNDNIPRPHPYNLVGQNCENGICRRHFTTNEQQINFPGIGVQCIKRKDIRKSIEDKLNMNLDPFGAHGSQKMIQTTDYDFTTVYLCFQVFLNLHDNDAEASCDNCQALIPIVSDAIENKRAELQIIDFAPGASSCKGGEKIIILCKKLKKQDEIEVVFLDIHGKPAAGCGSKTIGNALVLKAPPFGQMNIYFPVEIEMFIRMKNDADQFSERVTFKYSPHQNEEEFRKTTAGAMKRRKIEDDAPHPGINCSYTYQEPPVVAVDAPADADLDENDFELRSSHMNSSDSTQMPSYSSSLLDFVSNLLNRGESDNLELVEVQVVEELTETTNDNMTTNTPVIHIPSPENTAFDVGIDIDLDQLLSTFDEFSSSDLA